MNAPTGELEDAHGKGRVLIVDDAATVRRYHRMIVEDAGYSVEEAFNGVEALELAFRMKFDLYLVDVNMPEMDGYHFVSEIRKSDTSQPSPIVMISTEADGRDAARAYQVGANYYIVKPAPPEMLKVCLDLLTDGGVS